MNAEEKKEKALAYAYNLLRIRPRTEKELNVRLNKKGFDKSVSQGLVLLFKEKGLIDDLKFARLWVDSRLKLSPKGDMLLRQELLEKGVSQTIIKQVLSEKKEGEEIIVRRLAEERIRVLKGLPKLKAKKRLHDYLARRGFKYDIIDDVINNVIDTLYAR